MNFTALSDVVFGDKQSLDYFLFENGIQHQVFRDKFLEQGNGVPAFPIFDVDTANLDDWLLPHQVEHQVFANLLGLENPFNMLDVNWNNQVSFYDWLSTHLFVHEQIASALGVY